MTSKTWRRVLRYSPSRLPSMPTWRNMKPFFLKEASNVIAIESLGVNLQISVSSYACRPEQHIKTSMRICNEVKRMWKGHATSSQLHPEAWSWRKSNALPSNTVGKGGVVKPAGTEAQETHGLPNFLEIVPVDGESGEWQNPWGITGSFEKSSSPKWPCSRVTMSMYSKRSHMSQKIANSVLSARWAGHLPQACMTTEVKSPSTLRMP